ncbi:MAG: DMT family transporter [Steroidobacteraceae bacterium]
MSRLSATLLLLLTTLIWGFTFVVQKWATSHGQSIDAITFTGVRFLLGALTVTALMLRETRAATAPLRGLHQLGFIACGLILLAGSWLQQHGLATTSVTNAGFFTGIYVGLVPFLGWWLFRIRPHALIWPALVAMVAGIWLLNGGSLTRIGSGDAWILSSTVFWGLHVTLVGVLSAASARPLTLAWAQFLVAGLIGTLAALLFGHTTLAVLGGTWRELLWSGVMSVGVAFTLQVVAQRYVQPAVAAIVLGSEIVFTALAGAIFLHERLTPAQITGGVLIFAAILAVEAVPQLTVRRSAAASPDP